MPTNIAAYHFAPLDNLKALRADLLGRCQEDDLKGTILLSPEGINLFVAGPVDALDRLLIFLRAIPGLEPLQAKYSDSSHQPFNRMLVRLKKEIIAFGVEGIEPAKRTAPKLAPRELKRWLDEGRPITLLDTRNDYEVKLGTFRGAVVPHIDHFREFPQAVAEMPEALKDQPIVMFCTGGIRCEKAGPYMQREGFKEVYQLEGGILKYFEDCGGDHYDGECFVFDQRVGVDPALRETASVICFACQTPLTVEEQAHPHYVIDEHCPYCYQPDAEQRAALLARRQAELSAAADPLPGSVPYTNRRPLQIPERLAGQTLLAALCDLFPHVDAEEWAARCTAERFLDQNDAPLSADSLVSAHQRLGQLQPGTAEPPVNADIRILYEDDALVVLHKPAPLPMHPAGRFNRNTLTYLLDQVYAPHRPRPAHRLDANTSGVVVCARTRHVASRLQPLFAEGRVEKTYLVRVIGQPTADSFACEAAISDEPGPLGSRTTVSAGEPGKAARTEFRVLRRDAERHETLLEARPLTGRTNQIRVHLWHLGWPIVGDPVYLPDRQIGSTQTLSLDDAPLCLHATAITFPHPGSGETVTFTAPAPAWAEP